MATNDSDEVYERLYQSLDTPDRHSTEKPKRETEYIEPHDGNEDVVTGLKLEGDDSNNKTDKSSTQSKSTTNRSLPRTPEDKPPSTQTGNNDINGGKEDVITGLKLEGDDKNKTIEKSSTQSKSISNRALRRTPEDNPLSTQTDNSTPSPSADTANTDTNNKSLTGTDKCNITSSPSCKRAHSPNKRNAPQPGEITPTSDQNAKTPTNITVSSIKKEASAERINTKDKVPSPQTEATNLNFLAAHTNAQIAPSDESFRTDCEPANARPSCSFTHFLYRGTVWVTLKTGGSWKRRYASINGKTRQLHIFLSIDHMKPFTSVLLSRCRVLPLHFSASKREHSFQLAQFATPSSERSKRIIFLAATSREQQRAWLRAIMPLCLNGAMTSLDVPLEPPLQLRATIPASVRRRGARRCKVTVGKLTIARINLRDLIGFGKMHLALSFTPSDLHTVVLAQRALNCLVNCAPGSFFNIPIGLQFSRGISEDRPGTVVPCSLQPCEIDLVVLPGE